MVVFFGGMPENFESEGADRPHMDMPGQQNALIHAIAQVNPNLAVVLNAGSPVALPWLDEAGAVVEAYYHGQEGGRAVANVLSGAVNPSGKLTVTFPKRLEDTPAYLNYPGGRQVQYGEGIFVGYRYYDARDVAPLFPFGHGLSYTTFSYSNLKLPFLAAVGDTVRVALEVSNTGTRAGAEIVQLYVADRQSSLPRPPKELKGFQKIYLKPGETKEIAFELDRRSFAFYDPSAEKWIVEPGDFEIQLGSSSRDIRLQGNLLLQSE
jgi:beta-glucosidase